MEYKDYYAILGVSKDAEQAAIKKAFRDQARKYHPDINKAPDAEKKFKDINEANEVLSDPEKRKKYDQLGRRYQEWERAGSPQGGPGGFDWSQWTSGQPGGGQYADPNAAYSDFFEAIFGSMGGFGGQQGGGFVDLDELLRGGGRTTGRSRGQRSLRGQDLEAEAVITLDEAYNGTTRLYTKGDRRIQVKIPRGAKTGTKVRLSGIGNEGMAGGAAGDLYLSVVVDDDPRFDREGDDLYTDANVDLYPMLLGGEIQIPTMRGSLTMKVKPGTQPGQLIRLKGRGMPKIKGTDEFGDLFVRMNVVLPTELSAKERALFRELANMRGHNYDRED